MKLKINIIQQKAWNVIEKPKNKEEKQKANNEIVNLITPITTLNISGLNVLSEKNFQISYIS